MGGGNRGRDALERLETWIPTRFAQKTYTIFREASEVPNNQRYPGCIFTFSPENARTSETAPVNMPQLDVIHLLRMAPRFPRKFQKLAEWVCGELVIAYRLPCLRIDDLLAPRWLAISRGFYAIKPSAAIRSRPH